MNLYLDEDTADTLLIAVLRKAGHQVTVPHDVGLLGVSDPRQFFHAISQGEHSRFVGNESTRFRASIWVFSRGSGDRE